MASPTSKPEPLRNGREREGRDSRIERERKKEGKRRGEREDPRREKIAGVRFRKKPRIGEGTAVAFRPYGSPKEKVDGEAARQKAIDDGMQKSINKLEAERNELIRDGRLRDSEIQRLRDEISRYRKQLEKAKRDLDLSKAGTIPPVRPEGSSAPAKSGGSPRSTLSDHLVEKVRKLGEDNVSLAGDLLMARGELRDLRSEMTGLKESSRKTEGVDGVDRETEKTVLSTELDVFRGNVATVRGLLTHSQSDCTLLTEKLQLAEARASVAEGDLDDAIMELERLKGKFPREKVDLPVKRQHFSGTSRM